MSSSPSAAVRDRAFHIVTLGCSKNRVDSDGMAHLLRQRGMAAVDRPADASVVVVNTGSGFCAYQAMCPHEAIPLEQGIHDGCLLTCLEHMWQFDLKTGAPVGEAETGVTVYPLKEEAGALYVQLG